MVVTVEGVVTSIGIKRTIRDNVEKISTELLLAQANQKEQVTIRLNGDVTSAYKLFTPELFTGRLMTWTTRNGVGSMIMVEDEQLQDAAS
ncbi:hypothetical protein FHS15_005800 [Paenibacillus castaneae]|uniref:hypothetical protein n=1 Tax=Paenibacillus castaneae TaxID=474957 RepID=UPI00141BE853|nr:hypothetical protein [Paenibacillus castaneae]NIK80609.1 hypothetical protein [Paenibacillus castaneae]